MTFPAAQGRAERAAGRRAVRRAFAREHAGQAFVALCFLVAVVFSGLVSR